MKPAKILGALLLTAAPLQAEPVSLDAEVAAKTDYLGNMGFMLEEGPAVQSSVTAGKCGFYGNFWANYGKRKDKLTEADYTVGYAKSVGGIDMDVSCQIFDQMNQGKDKLNDNIHQTQFVFGKKVKALLPKLILVQNISGGKLPNQHGRYADLSLGYERHMWKLGLSCDAGLIYNDKCFIPKSELGVAYGDASVSFNKGNMTFKAFARGQKALGKEFENSGYVGASVSFRR